MFLAGPTPIGQIVFYFLASLAGCFSLVLLASYGSFRAYRLLKASFYPNIQLPDHFKEYLRDLSPGSDMPQLLQPERESELFLDRLSVCSAVALLEIHTPPPGAVMESSTGPEQDSSTHCRQGSGDSGVYSTEEGSGQTVPDSGQGIPRGQESWKKPPVSVLEQVKMEEMSPGPRYRGLIDEGVLDVCV
ncbi:interferon alpha/beta receptor 1b-like [Aplochiton taeniatus]